MTVSTNEVVRALRTSMGPQGADALADLISQQQTRSIAVPLNALTQEDGTTLLKQATTVAGYAQLSNKEVAVYIPVNCSAGEALQFTLALPLDLKAGAPMSIKVLASKVEGGTPDVLTFAVEAYISAAGDLANADACATSAQTIVTAGSVLAYNITPASVLAPPATLTAVLTLGGTNDADAVYLRGIWVDYTAN